MVWWAFTAQLRSLTLHTRASFWQCILQRHRHRHQIHPSRSRVTIGVAWNVLHENTVFGWNSRTCTLLPVVCDITNSFTAEEPVIHFYSYWNEQVRLAVETGIPSKIALFSIWRQTARSNRIKASRNEGKRTILYPWWLLSTLVK